MDKCGHHSLLNTLVLRYSFSMQLLSSEEKIPIFFLILGDTSISQIIFHNLTVHQYCI